MAHISGASRVLENSSSSGTGNITVTGAVSGFRALSSVLASNGDTADVLIAHSSAAEWEHCRITRVSATDYSRATPFSSSNAGAAVSFSSGGLLVFITRGERELALDPDGAVELPAVAAIPPSPPADTVAFYGRKRAGRMYLDVQGPSGRDYPVMPHLGYNGIAEWRPGTGTGVHVLGMPITNVGTISHPAPTSTNIRTQAKRINNLSAATANSAAESRSALAGWWRGNAAGLGGFTFVARFGMAALSTNVRSLVGLTSSTAAISTSQVPGSLQNMLGFTFNAAETNWFFQHAAAATPTRIDLGSNFPTNVTNELYTMVIHCNPNASSVFYRLVRESTGQSTDGEVSTNMPAATQFLAPHLYANNGGDAVAISWDCPRLTIETDY